MQLHHKNFVLRYVNLHRYCSVFYCKLYINWICSKVWERNIKAFMYSLFNKVYDINIEIQRHSSFVSNFREMGKFEGTKLIVFSCRLLNDSSRDIDLYVRIIRTMYLSTLYIPRHLLYISSQSKMEIMCRYENMCKNIFKI